MERFQFELECGGGDAASGAQPVVVGVVASGHLEVLVEGGAPTGRCQVSVATSVNDAGATPAVVSLRLDQAIEEFRRGGA
jgi:malonate decarboxylase delta subunit